MTLKCHAGHPQAQGGGACTKTERGSHTEGSRAAGWTGKERHSITETPGSS